MQHELTPSGVRQWEGALRQIVITDEMKILAAKVIANELSRTADLWSQSHQSIKSRFLRWKKKPNASFVFEALEEAKRCR